MLLFNIFSNKLDNFVNSSDNEDIISHYQKKNTTSPWLPITGRNRVASHSGMEEKTAETNRIAGYSGIKLGMEGANGDLSDVRFSIKE